MTQRLSEPPTAPAAPTDAGVLFRDPGWDRARIGDVSWRVLRGWTESLIGPGGLRLDQWRREGALTTVKAGPHRVVYRADLPGGPVFVKHFLVPNFRAVLRQWFRRGKGRNEGKRAVRLAAIGVPTITPIALGEQRKRGFLFENYLITPAIPGTVPLDEFVQEHLPALPEPRRSRVRRAVAEAVGVLAARLHEAGFVHDDFHPGNLLIRLDGECPRLAMIDLDALRFRRSLSRADARANLALLNHYFWTRSARSDRLRFLLAYFEARGGRPGDAGAFAREIESATRTWAERLWRRWGRRCRGSNKYFRAYRDRDARAAALASRDLDPAVVAGLLADPDAPLGRPDAVILKNSRTTTVAELTLPVLGVPTKVIYKKFPRKKRLDPIFALFRPSRAWQAWQAGQHLACRGVPTPRNLAVVGRLGRLNLLPRDTYLVTVKAEPSITLGDYAREVLPTLDPAARRVQTRRLARALAGLIRNLHGHSLSHRDLKAANILIEGDPAAAEPRLCLIDLVGVRLKYPLPAGRRLQNLARLAVSLSGSSTRADALRFLRAYGPLPPLAGWKAAWRAIAARARVKEARNARTGRALS